MKLQLENIKEQTESAENKTSDSKKGRLDLGIFDIAEPLVGAVLIVIIVMAFFVRIVDVNGASMKPTLQDGDRLIVSPLGYTPKRGDVVVTTGAADYGSPIIKRVIALGGDTVDIDFVSGVVTVNGERESYIDGITFTKADVEFPITVPEGTVFVMGDNRAESLDSRSSSIGCIDERCILGKVIGRFYPLGRWEVE